MRRPDKLSPPPEPLGHTWLARRDVPTPDTLLGLGRPIQGTITRPLASSIIPVPELARVTGTSVLHAYATMKYDLTDVKAQLTEPAKWRDYHALGRLSEQIFTTSDQLSLIALQLSKKHQAIARGLRHDIGNQITGAYSSLINFLYDPTLQTRETTTLIHQYLNQAQSAVFNWLPILEIASGRNPSYQLSINQILHQLQQMQLTDIRLFLPPGGRENIFLSPALPIIIGNLNTNSTAINGPRTHRGLVAAAAIISSRDQQTQPKPIINLIYFDQGQGYPNNFFDQSSGLPLVGQTLRPSGTGQGLTIIGTFARAMDARIRLGNWGEPQHGRGGAFTQILIPLK